MRKSLKIPFEMTIRMTASALSNMKHCLPLLPGSSEASKFNPSELLEILECSLSYAWRQKFDYDGYIPADGTRA